MSNQAYLGQAIDAFRRGDLEAARKLAERQLATAPSPQCRHLLGLVLCRLGKPDSGVEHLRAAADSEPGNAAFQLMLVRALVDAGRAPEALELPEPPHSRQALPLWQARGEAATAAGDQQAAVAAWSKVTASAPDDWRAWSNLGNAFAAQGRWGEAAEALLEAVRVNPSEPTVRRNAIAALIRAAAQLQTLLRFDDAVAALEEAYRLDSSDVAVVRQLGVALERTNRLDRLERLLDEAEAAGIANDRLGYLRALLARRRGEPEKARQLLLASDPADDPVAWHALRVKIEDALGNSEEAFEAAAAMNLADLERTVPPERREEFRKSAADYRQEQRELARTITPEWGSKVPVLPDPPPRRVAFLLGFPRSGTTLLDTFLMGHPQIEVLEEKQLVSAAAKVAGPVERLPEVTVERLKEARAAYFEALGDHVDPRFGGIVIDKFPLDLLSAPLIHALFPKAPIIFAKRHPCDVVLSGFMQSFGLVNFSDIRDIADYYDAVMSVWHASADALPLNVRSIVYEDLVKDPEKELRPLVSFLGLDWDPQILDHRRTAKERGTIQTPSYDQVTEPVSTRPAGRWKRYRSQLEPVLPMLLRWAERLGYDD